MKIISTKAGVNTNLTTYVARHSFASVLKRSGVNTSIISESLGHSSEKVTQIYLDSFENSQIKDSITKWTYIVNIYKLNLIEGYKSPFFPFLQIIFVVVAIWMIALAFLNNTYESLAGLSNVVIGLITYLVNKKIDLNKQKQL